MLLTTAAWSRIWLVWMASAFGSFLVVEFSSILVRRAWFGTALAEWTLSDFIRRWSEAYHILPVIIVACFAGLAVHFFWKP